MMFAKGKLLHVIPRFYAVESEEVNCHVTCNDGLTVVIRFGVNLSEMRT